MVCIVAKKTMTKLVIVTSIQNEKTMMEHLDAWKTFLLPTKMYVSHDIYSTVERIMKPYEHVTVERLVMTQDLPYYVDGNMSLPMVRNEAKDTREYLWHVHKKVHCLYEATANAIDEQYWMYLDFHAPNELFRDVDTYEYLRDLSNKPHLFVEHENRMYIPGCWSLPENVEHDEFGNHVHWRFCGSLLFGSKKAIEKMYDYYQEHFPEFVKLHGLSWEVNYWAYMERKLEWEPVWYAANHDDSMVRLPNVFSYSILHEDKAIVEKVYDYPEWTPYRPMSAAYVEYLGKSVLNTRYVNYWIYDQGGYYYPEDEGVIRTLNVCSILESNMPTNYVVMREKTGAVPRPGCFSEGIEDIRLYVSQKTGQLCFLGSTLGYSNNERIKMIHGDYDIENQCCSNMELIESPYDTWCEKNWAPIRLPNEEDGFIYKWFPLEIGTIVRENGICKLKIVHHTTTDKWFRQIKGSTGFVPFQNQLLGVVHFSYEKSPRQYYHQLVMIDKTNLTIMKTSSVFCFLKPSVEFCIGFRVDLEHFGFWISQMDREPLYLEIKQNKIWF